MVLQGTCHPWQGCLLGTGDIGMVPETDGHVPSTGCYLVAQQGPCWQSLRVQPHGGPAPLGKSSAEPQVNEWTGPLTADQSPRSECSSGQHPGRPRRPSWVVCEVSAHEGPRSTLAERPGASAEPQCWCGRRGGAGGVGEATVSTPAWGHCGTLTGAEGGAQMWEACAGPGLASWQSHPQGSVDSHLTEGTSGHSPKSESDN